MRGARGSPPPWLQIQSEISPLLPPTNGADGDDAGLELASNGRRHGPGGHGPGCKHGNAVPLVIHENPVNALPREVAVLGRVFRVPQLAIATGMIWFFNAASLLAIGLTVATTIWPDAASSNSG